MTSQPIIDTHFHIWDTDVLTLPWLSLFEGQLKKKYTMDDYIRAIKGHNITESCYEEVDAIKAHHKQEAEMIIDLCQDSSNQIMGATIAADLSSSHFKHYIGAFAQEPVVKSIRHNMFVNDVKITKTKTFRANVNLLAELNIMCDLVLPVKDILYGVDLVKACPDTTFVINHCGVCPILAAPQTKTDWQKGIENYASQDNVICKISECGFTAPGYTWQVSDVMDIIQHCVSHFGEERIVYGTNWPVCEMTGSISQWLEAINICLRYFPEQVANKLFYTNAKKYYQL